MNDSEDEVDFFRHLKAKDSPDEKQIQS